MQASFSMPTVQDNLTGWGPAADSAPDHLRHLPYAPFNKSDRLGRACEWGNTRERDRRWQNKNKATEEISPFIVEQVLYLEMPNTTSPRPPKHPNPRPPNHPNPQPLSPSTLEAQTLEI